MFTPSSIVPSIHSQPGVPSSGVFQNAPTLVTIALAERSYPIAIGTDLLGDPATYAALPQAATALIVTNTTVAPLYADALRSALAGKYAQVHVVVLPDGEENKNWQTLNLIFDALLQHGYDPV